MPYAPFRWENSVVIFDEAHNVENVCSDSYSFDLTATQVGAWLGQGCCGPG